MRGWRGLREGGRLDKAVYVEILEGGSCGRRIEGQRLRSAREEEPAASLELIEDKAEDHSVWDEGA